jgi:hypothetical protein
MCSPTGEGRYVGLQDYDLLSQILAEGDVFSSVGTKGEVRCLVSYFCWHVHLLKLVAL